MRVNERTISWTKCKLWSWSYKLSFLCTYWPAKAKLMPSFICSSSTTWLTLSVRDRTRLGRRFNSVKKTVYWMRWVRHMTMSFSDIYYRCPHCAFKCVWMTIINGSLIFFPSVWRDDFPKLTNQRHVQVPPQTCAVKDWFFNSFTTKIASFKVRRSLVIYLIIYIFFWRVVLELHAHLASVI